MAPLSFTPLRFPLWVLGKPAFFNSFGLVSEFQNRPKAGTPKNAESGRWDCLTDKTGHGKRQNSSDQEQRPYLLREVILRFDHDGMENAYDSKRYHAYHQSFNSHIVSRLQFPYKNQRERCRSSLLAFCRDRNNFKA
jgi:hypothetical protein